MENGNGAEQQPPMVADAIEDVLRARIFKQYGVEKRELGEEITKLIQAFEVKWNVYLVKTHSMVSPRDIADANSLPVVRSFGLDFGC